MGFGSHEDHRAVGPQDDDKAPHRTGKHIAAVQADLTLNLPIVHFFPTSFCAIQEFPCGVARPKRHGGMNSQKRGVRKLYGFVEIGWVGLGRGNDQK